MYDTTIRPELRLIKRHTEPFSKLKTIKQVNINETDKSRKGNKIDLKA